MSSTTNTNFTPTGRITAVRAAAMSDRELVAALNHPGTSPGGRQTIRAEQKKRLDGAA